MTSLDLRNTNSLWCSVLVETLVRCGVRDAVVSPGSRSAPLTMALARHAGIAAIPVLDERSAGFFALGLAKRRARPVALVCTSGTAGANFFPAVIEAAETGVALIVLTADRPPELRDCHSGQTIDQQKLYGRFVNFTHEFAVPQASLPLLRYLRQTVAHAVERSVRPRGPVHLNCPFRDPLPPVAEANPVPLTSASFAGFFAGLGEGFSTARQTTGARLRGGNGVIVAGPVEPDDPDAYARAVARLARLTGWPVLADALSPLRSRVRRSDPIVAHYDLILRDARQAQALRPDRVLCLGAWPTSKVLRGWLQAVDVPVTLVSERPANEDALHLRSRVVRARVEDFAPRLVGGKGARAYAALWRQADRRAARALIQGVTAEPGMIEPRWPAILARAVPAGTACFMANSMPVRDAEYFWPTGNSRLRVHFNRGANGIDGTLSTALGLAQADGRPSLLVTGDLALLHDANGFLIAPKFRGSLTILLINNRGGGIFGHLPVAQFEPPFEEFFATPQQVDFARLASAHGIPHVLVRDVGHLARLLGKLPRKGVRVLEMRTDRRRDAAFRLALFAARLGKPAGGTQPSH